MNLVDSPPAAYHLWNCSGFEGFADRSITVSAKDSLIGECMEEMQPKWYDLRDPETQARYLRVNNGTIGPRLAADRAWLAIVPIEEQKKHGRVSVAVCVDCDVPIEHNVSEILPKINDLVTEFA